MPITPTYPGVYIEEVPSGVRTIVGVATSITAFIGRARQGTTEKAVRIQSFAEFERQFDGLWVESAMSYAVQQYFLNGGTDAIIIRVVGAGAAKGTTTVGGIELEAASEGKWSEGLQAVIDLETADSKDADPKLFNLIIERPDPKQPTNRQLAQKLEVFRNLSTDPKAARFVTKVLEQQSAIARVAGEVPNGRPSEGSGSFGRGEDGAVPTYAEYLKPENPQAGLETLLDKVDLFNLLCIPPNVRGTTVVDNNGQNLLSEALAYCKKRRAMLIIDPPSSWSSPLKVQAEDTGVDSFSFGRDKNAAIFFPEVIMPDPLRENNLESFPPCGVVAGIMARTDAQRGVWKAPAGIEATMIGVKQLSYKLTDGENGLLNPLGVNCLRSFPVYGNVVWGARTLRGADQLADEWKYLPVRRFALFIEESLYRGTQWVVFEPNDEPLWAQIRLNIGAFMNNLFRQGAFQGSTPREAYFVKCDKETTTQNDINLGIVNIVVGFAPLKPAEFVVIKIQQIAGDIAT